MQRKGACALYQERSDVERRRARAIACERKREASYFLVFLRTDQSEFRFQFFFSFFFFFAPPFSLFFIFFFFRLQGCIVLFSLSVFNPSTSLTSLETRELIIRSKGYRAATEKGEIL